MKKGEGEGEKENEESSENKEASWVSGLEGTCTIARNSLTYYPIGLSSGIVKNVTEYAVTVGETVKTRVQAALSNGPTLPDLPLPLSPPLPPYLPHSLLPPSPHHTHTHTHTQPVSFMNQFQAEQEKFAREKRRLRDAAVPPWVGYNEEEQMKAQILELSAVRENHVMSLFYSSSVRFRTVEMYCAILHPASSSTLTLLNRTLLPWQCLKRTADYRN